MGMDTLKAGAAAGIAAPAAGKAARRGHGGREGELEALLVALQYLLLRAERWLRLSERGGASLRPARRRAARLAVSRARRPRHRPAIPCAGHALHPHPARPAAHH